MLQRLRVSWRARRAPPPPGRRRFVRFRDQMRRLRAILRSFFEVHGALSPANLAPGPPEHAVSRCSQADLRAGLWPVLIPRDQLGFVRTLHAGDRCLIPADRSVDLVVHSVQTVVLPVHAGQPLL